MKHRYAEMLGWLAEGKGVQARMREAEYANFPGAFSMASSESVLLGEPGWEFRLKPRTVKIGSREVEAPVLEPSNGQRVWLLTREKAYGFDYELENERSAALAKAGFLFESQDACLATLSAVIALLRGEP